MIAPSGPQIYPMLHQRVSWLDVMLPIGLGGMWLSAFFWLLSGKPFMVQPAEAAVEGHHA